MILWYSWNISVYDLVLYKVNDFLQMCFSVAGACAMFGLEKKCYKLTESMRQPNMCVCTHLMHTYDTLSESIYLQKLIFPSWTILYTFLQFIEKSCGAETFYFIYFFFPILVIILRYFVWSDTQVGSLNVSHGTPAQYAKPCLQPRWPGGLTGTCQWHNLPALDASLLLQQPIYLQYWALGKDATLSLQYSCS